MAELYLFMVQLSMGSPWVCTGPRRAQTLVPVAAAREVGEAGLGGVAVGRVALVEEEAVAAALVAEPYLVQVDRVAAELSPACAGENRLVLN